MITARGGAEIKGDDVERHDTIRYAGSVQGRACHKGRRGRKCAESVKLVRAEKGDQAGPGDRCRGLRR